MPMQLAWYLALLMTDHQALLWGENASLYSPLKARGYRPNDSKIKINTVSYVTLLM